MLFFGLLDTYLMIYILAAIAPAIVLLVMVYRKDKVEPEPIGLIFSLIGFGILAALVSIILETIAQKLLPVFIKPDNPYYTIFFAFLAVAVIEEGTKFFFLHKRTWRDWNFNYSFDGIVYAVSVSLGFAAFENVGYVFNYGLTVAPTRAVLAIPGHMSFAIFMGLFYGKAKSAYDEGRDGLCLFYNILAYVTAVFCHGVYDSCAMIGTEESQVVFLIFVVAMFIVAFSTIQIESKHDHRV